LDRYTVNDVLSEVENKFTPGVCLHRGDVIAVTSSVRTSASVAEIQPHRFLRCAYSMSMVSEVSHHPAVARCKIRCVSDTDTSFR
jgi:hypothetical protein